MIGFSTTVFAQEAADKKVQAGLVIGGGMNFQKMGTKNIKTDGLGGDWTIGSNVNFSFNDNIGLCTGVEFDLNSIKYAMNMASPVYYNYNDVSIRDKEDKQNGDELFELTNRKYSNVYLTIPTMMIFRSKFVGYFRYFGKFGLRNSFLLSSKIKDEGYSHANGSPLTTGSAADMSGMKSPGDMFFVKSAVGIAGGAEWNFTGSTTLMAEIGYYYGFVPLHVTNKEDNMTLYTSGVNNGTGNDKYFANKASQGQLMFKVSILF